MNRRVNSSNNSVESMACKFLIQLLFLSSEQTDLFFNLATLNRLGARFLGASPSSHLASQNRVFLSFPTVMVVELKNSSLSTASVIFRRYFHGLSQLSQLCQSQRNLRALLYFSRSLNSSPPNLFGLRQVCQLSRQWPPLMLSGFCPFHKKLLLNLPILAKPHLGILKIVKKICWHSSEHKFDKKLSSRISEEFSFPPRESIINLLHHLVKQGPGQFLIV
jgi:hypothetical protein